MRQHQNVNTCINKFIIIIKRTLCTKRDNYKQFSDKIERAADSALLIYTDDCTNNLHTFLPSGFLIAKAALI